MGQVDIHGIAWLGESGGGGGGGGGGSTLVKIPRVFYVGSPAPTGIQNAFSSYSSLRSFWSDNPTEAPSASNPVTVYFLPGQYNEQIILPDFTRAQGLGRVIIGGSDSPSASSIIELGMGCELWGVNVTPALRNTSMGIHVRDATTIITPNLQPYNVDGRTLILNGGEDDIVITFSGNNLSASAVADQIMTTVAGNHILAYAANNRVYISSLDYSLSTHKMIVRSSGTANGIFGFSTTQDTVKERVANSTVFISDCTIIGYSGFSSINNGHGWTLGGLVLFDSGEFTTLVKNVAIDGGGEEAAYGVVHLAGAPLLTSCAISNVKNDGAAIFLYDIPDTKLGILALAVVTGRNNYRDFLVRTPPGGPARTILVSASGLNTQTLHEGSNATLQVYSLNRPLGISVGGLKGEDPPLGTLGLLANTDVEIPGSCYTETLYSFSKVTPDLSTGRVKVGPGAYSVAVSLALVPNVAVTLTLKLCSDTGVYPAKTYAQVAKNNIVNITLHTIYHFATPGLWERDLRLVLRADTNCTVTIKSISFVIHETEPGASTI